METSSGCAARQHKFRGRLILALLLGTTLFAPMAFGDVAIVSPCATTDTLANFEGHSCLLEGYTLSGFSFSATGTQSPLLTASEITVDTSHSDPSHLNLQFTAAPGFSFHADAGLSAMYTFQYFIDPVLPMIDTQSMDLGPNDPVSLTGNFCGDGTFNTDGHVCSNLPEFHMLGLSGPSTDTQTTGFTYDPVSTEEVELILDLTGGANAGSDLFGALGSITGVAPIPEPSTIAVVLVLSLLMVVKHFKLSRPR